MKIEDCKWCGKKTIIPSEIKVVRCVNCGRILGRYQDGVWTLEEECPYQDVCATTIYWKNEQRKFIEEVCENSEHNHCLHFISSGHFMKEEQDFQKLHVQILDDNGELVWVTNEEFTAIVIEFGILYNKYLSDIKSGKYIVFITRDGIELIPKNKMALINRINKEIYRDWINDNNVR